jgi:GINS complex subunit 1
MNYGQYGRDLLHELKRSSGGAAAGNTNSAASEPPLTAYNDETVRNCLEDLKLHVQALQDQVQANSGNVLPSSARRGGSQSQSQSQSQSPTAASTSSSSNSTAASTKPSFAVRPSILLQTAAIQRNKRCLLTYHVARLERIKEHFYWKSQDPDEQQQSNASNSASNSANTTTNTNTNTTTTNASGGSTRKILCPSEEEWLRQYRTIVDRYTATTGLPPGTLVAHSMVPPVQNDRVLIRVVTEAEEFAGGDAICLESGATACFVLGSTHFVLLNDVEEYLRAGHVQLLDGEEEGQ